MKLKQEGGLKDNFRQRISQVEADSSTPPVVVKPDADILPIRE